MHKKFQIVVQRGWKTAVTATALLVLLFGINTGGAIPRAQPLLMQLAAQQPDSTISIIVRKSASDDAVERAVAALGGTVVKDLRIINALAVEMPARQVAQLAQSDGVRWVSLDAPVVSTACASCIDTSKLVSKYIQTIGADRVWNEAPYIQGQNVTVAVVDSGIVASDDFRATISGGNSRVIYRKYFDPSEKNNDDHFAHGTHVAGIIGGNGRRSAGAYIGVAPKVNLISLKVADQDQKGKISTVIDALQWIYDNRATYNIRVVNLSFSTTVQESYLTNPLDAAVEILWFNKVVVVVAAGNSADESSSGKLYPPANDPFVITVGASKDMGTVNPSDDVRASYSAYGTTSDGFAKPELVAPGHNIVSVLASGGAELSQLHPDHQVNGTAYFRMSGTSMSAAVTTGAVALLIQSNPNLTPDQIKYRLIATARPMNQVGTGAGLLDIYAAVRGTTTASSNTGIRANDLLWTGSTPVTWNSVNWSSVNWSSVNWSAVNWSAVNWSAVNWSAVNWSGALYWDD